MRRYQWEDRERFYLETDTHRVYIDPHDDWYPGYSESDALKAMAGYHTCTEIHYESKNPQGVERSPYPRCVRCSKRHITVKSRTELNNILFCDRCYQATNEIGSENKSYTWYQINDDGTKGQVIN